MSCRLLQYFKRKNIYIYGYVGVDTGTEVSDFKLIHPGVPNDTIFDIGVGTRRSLMVLNKGQNTRFKVSYRDILIINLAVV